MQVELKSTENLQNLPQGLSKAKFTRRTTQTASMSIINVGLGVLTCTIAFVRDTLLYNTVIAVKYLTWQPLVFIFNVDELDESNVFAIHLKLMALAFWIWWTYVMAILLAFLAFLLVALAISLVHLWENTFETLWEHVVYTRQQRLERHDRRLRKWDRWMAYLDERFEAVEYAVCSPQQILEHRERRMRDYMAYLERNGAMRQ